MSGPRGILWQFYVHHPQPCRDPNCATRRDLVQVSMSTFWSDQFLVQLEPAGQGCTAVAERIRRKAVLLNCLRNRAIDN